MGRILPSGGVASGRVCACSLRSRIVFLNLKQFQNPKIGLKDTAMYRDGLKMGGFFIAVKFHQGRPVKRNVSKWMDFH